MRHRVLNALPALTLLTAVALPSFAFEGARFQAETAFGAAQNTTLPPFTLRPHTQAVPPAPPTVCSGLDFHSVTWPASFSAQDTLALMLALNISGSFEGGEGWANITGNFDGQGLSLGLLNQNLGQGSLQPLMVKLRDDHFPVFSSLFSPAHLPSVLGMLADWEGHNGPPKPPHQSRTDEPPAGSALLAPGEAGSVLWARNTIYTGAHFDPVWKAELIAMAEAPEFVTLQIAAAVELHDRALDYERQMGIRELRAYLMMFDVAVQNGGIYPEDFSDYDDYRRANPSASDTQKLEKMLVLRLRHVRKRFVADVRSRKRSIIGGKGVVHGERRDLPAQYCYDGAWPYK